MYITHVVYGTVTCVEIVINYKRYRLCVRYYMPPAELETIKNKNGGTTQID